MKKYFPAWLRTIVFFFGAFIAMEFFIDSGDRPAFIKYPIVQLVLAIYLLVLIAIEAVWKAIDHVTYNLLTQQQKDELEAAENQPLRERPWFKKMMNALTRSEPMESEAALLMDHDYDGIKELDNKLPPWWVYSFYATIVFAGIYMVRYHMMGGPTQEAELAQELAQAKIAVEEYKKTAPDMMTEDKVTLLLDKEALAKGKSLFDSNCAACHRADGGGQIGPNLTDPNWILGGGIKNVFHTITHGGRDGKGMIAWGGTLKPTEIQCVASYVISLSGTHPPEAKAAEGDLWTEESPAAPDSKQ